MSTVFFIKGFYKKALSERKMLGGVAGVPVSSLRISSSAFSKHWPVLNGYRERAGAVEITFSITGLY